MKMRVECGAIANVSADVLVVFAQKDSLSLPLEALDKTCEGFFSAQQQAGNWVESAKQVEAFYGVNAVQAARVVLAFWGEKGGDWQAAGRAVGAKVVEKNSKTLALALPEGAVENGAAAIFLRGLIEKYYRFETYKTAEKEKKQQAVSIEEVEIILMASEKEKVALEAQLNWVKGWQVGSFLTRDLGNQPPNVCQPQFLAEQAQDLAKAHQAVSVEILDVAQMQALGMGGVLGVGQGAQAEARFIVMDYAPKSAKNTAPYVLVGKGVTFDSGGISLKPSEGMELMKYDMGGAAAVFGAIAGLAEIDAPVRVVGLIPSVENMPDGNAFRPGDILTTMSGKTVEVLNTDAEGRLILCDALTYAERYEPKVVIDLATLTGACVVALGSPRCGLFGTDDALADALFAAGEYVHDRAWRLPIDSDYRETLKSKFADLGNISAAREAGASTAAAFLGEFAKNYPWAHLDIAGVAWERGAGGGGTGRPVALLLEYFAREIAGGQA